MAFEESGRQAWSFIGTGALKKGTMLKLTAVDGECDVATVVTDVPCGVALEDLPADANRATLKGAAVGVGAQEGDVYKVIGSTTIAIGAALGPTTGGEAVTITLSATYAQDWIFGIALSAAGAGGSDIVRMRYGPQIAS